MSLMVAEPKSVSEASLQAVSTQVAGASTTQSAVEESCELKAIVRVKTQPFVRSRICSSDVAGVADPYQARHRVAGCDRVRDGGRVGRVGDELEPGVVDLLARRGAVGVGADLLLILGREAPEADPDRGEGRCASAAAARARDSPGPGDALVPRACGRVGAVATYPDQLGLTTVLGLAAEYPSSSDVRAPGRPRRPKARRRALPGLRTTQRLAATTDRSS